MLSIITATKNVNEISFSKMLNYYNSLFLSGINFEWVVQDGTSKSNLLILCKNYSFVSFDYGSDDSIYSAWNKCILRAKGDKFCFLGIDDYPDANWLKYVEGFYLSRFDVIACKIGMIYEKSLIGIQENVIPGFNKFATQYYCHPGLVFSASLFINKSFKENYKIIGDYLFYANSSDLKVIAKFNKVGVKMSLGGISNSKKGSRIRFYELMSALRQKDLEPKYFVILFLFMPGYIFSFFPFKMFKIIQKFRWGNLL